MLTIAWKTLSRPLPSLSIELQNTTTVCPPLTTQEVGSGLRSGVKTASQSYACSGASAAAVSAAAHVHPFEATKGAQENLDVLVS
ncbi:hypothetical protein TcWFU_005002 [Taenia crassiceps]|uniref:Uncharacterized protein n=1 Tax=Taenia crassiceps TaxID=6207 RepID=A0ABR4Q147_9CEST